MSRPMWLRDPRGLVLGAMSGVCFSRALAYLVPTRNETLPVGLNTVAQHIDVRWLGVLWLLNAVGLLVVVFRQCPARWWNAWVMLTPWVWAIFYFIGWIAEGYDAKALSASILFAFFAVTIVGGMLVTPRRRP